MRCAALLYPLAVLMICPTDLKPSDAPDRLNISYGSGQLTINAQDVTLAEVLTRVATLLGVTIDLPPSASAEKMHVVKLGPGPARQIVSSLLSDSSFDYAIQESDLDPSKLQSVLVMLRPTKTGAALPTEVADRSPYVRAPSSPPPPEETPSSNPSASEKPQNMASEASPNTPSLQSPQATESAKIGSSLESQLQNPRPGALTPPETLNSETINQQLQQMYQQRMQMNGQAAIPSPTAK